MAELPDDDAAARRRRVSVAGHTGDVAAARSGLRDAHHAVRVAALRALDRLARLDDADLTAALADPVAGVRVAALDLAARRATPPIDAALDDPDSAVVEAACWACGERPGTAAVARVVVLATSHHDPLVREAAVAALGAIGDETGLPAVLAACGDKPAVRRRAVLALAAFEGPQVDAAWARARHDRDRQVRDAVEERLGPVDDGLDADDGSLSGDPDP